MAPLKLYHFPLSPPSRVATLVLKNLKLDAEIIIVDLLNQAQLAPDFLKINPQHTVPAIDDNGFYLWESRAIASYIVSAKAPGSSLYPTDVKKRAVVDARLYLDQALQIAGTDIMYPIFAQGVTTIPKDKKEKVYKILENFNTFLDGNKYAAGNELTIADLALLATISSMSEIGANITKFKNVAAWYKRLESIPGYQENNEEAKKMGNLIKSKVNITGTWDE